MIQRFRINDQIIAPRVHLIDESGQFLGVLGRDQALYLAYDRGFDLVEVGPSAMPPVVKIVEYGKFLYQQQKKYQKQKAGSKATEVKQIRLSAHIEPHDLETKAHHGQEFLAEGHKVKVSIVLRGRERAYSQQAFEMIRKFLELIQGRYDSPPRMMGNMIHAVIAKK